MTQERQLARVLDKARHLEHIYEARIFHRLDEVPMQAFSCREHLRKPPADAAYHPIKAGDVWGGEWENLWLHGTYTVPAHLADRPLYVMPRLGGWEGFLFLDGIPHAIFTNKYTTETHGNHYVARITPGAPAGTALQLDFEYYAGHYIPGCAPFEDSGLKDCRHTYEGVYIAERDEEILRFVMDLRVLNSLAKAMPQDSFRRGDVVRYLYDVVGLCPTALDDADEWRTGLRAATQRMQPVLEAKNAASAPITAVIGHSHMDTAWLWPVDETIRKCARTYANAVRLMDEYPEYRFFQSSAYHTEWYPRCNLRLFAAHRCTQRSDGHLSGILSQ